MTTESEISLLTRVAVLERRMEILFRMNRCADAFDQKTDEETKVLCEKFVEEGKKIINESASDARKELVQFMKEI